MKREPWLPFYAKRVADTIVYTLRLLKLVWDVWLMVRKANRLENADYMDAAISPEPVEVRSAPAPQDLSEKLPA